LRIYQSPFSKGQVANDEAKELPEKDLLKSMYTVTASGKKARFRAIQLRAYN